MHDKRVVNMNQLLLLKLNQQSHCEMAKDLLYQEALYSSISRYLYLVNMHSRSKCGQHRKNKKPNKICKDTECTVKSI